MIQVDPICVPFQFMHIRLSRYYFRVENDYRIPVEAFSLAHNFRLGIKLIYEQVYSSSVISEIYPCVRFL